jgi:hypothetical protein
MRIELNIGLNIEGSDNTQAQRDSRASFAIATLNMANGTALVGTRRAQSATEDTLIAICEGSGSDVAVVVAELAYELDQDCIALFNVETGVGQLIGPRAAAWGAFNPEYFLRFSNAVAA